MSNIQCSIMETPSRTSLLFDLAWAAAAFVFWGGWACYANLEAGLSVGIVSGLAQGAFSFAMTLLMVKAITMIYNRLHGHRFRYLLPAVATIACSGTLLAVTHLLAGTPNILADHFPPPGHRLFLLHVHRAAIGKRRQPRFVKHPRPEDRPWVAPKRGALKLTD